MRNNKTNATAFMLALAIAAGVPAIAGAETVLRIGMTAADIPRTLGQPDQGFEGNRFTGLTIYDALTMWDLSSSDKASAMIPGLATEWKVDDADKTKWVFKLRPGVTFHDGSPFNADAVVWNVDKVLKQDAPQYDASQVGVTASRMPTLVSARKIDDMTVELTTKEPDSFLPINLTNLFMASPAKWQQFYDKAEGADAKAKAAAPGAGEVELGALPPVSVASETGHAVSPDDVLDLLAPAFAHWQARLAQDGFAPVRAAWMARAARLGQTITARTGPHARTGRFDGIDEAGASMVSVAVDEAIRAIKPGEELTFDELIEFLNEHLARFKQPKEMIVIDELPRNASGKVVKPSLRKEYGGKDAGLKH